MVSDAAVRAQWVAAGALLFGAGWFAHGAADVRGLAMAGMAALCGGTFAWRAGRRSAAAPFEVPPAQPHARLHAQFHDTARADRLDTWLEFAPVALFSLGGGPAVATDRAPEALNTAARRLLAPGRIVDPSGLGRQFAGLAAGRRTVLGIETERGAERALANAVDLTVEGRPQRLVALSPIESELEAEAMQAWQKLVHVLTHEIMNSLTPVASLSQTARDLLHDAPGLAPDVATDLDTALDAIGRRAASLTGFVTGYRSLASVPEPRPERIVVRDLFARLQAMVEREWTTRGGRVRFTTEPPNLELLADPGQIEQALMNLTNNALQATAGLPSPELTVGARLVRGCKLRIDVVDNGRGVEEQIAGRIFTPFFTTRADGSGIGLAMVRQLVHRNGGAVRHARTLGGGAHFVITF
jgi:signal transduction histidine kinase